MTGLHALRHTAAYRMAEDPALSLTGAVRPWPCPADHDADLPDAPQGGSDPAGAGPSRRADPAGGGADPACPGAGVPAQDAGCAVPERRVVTAAVSEPVPVRTAPGSRQAARARFPAQTHTRPREINLGEHRIRRNKSSADSHTNTRLPPNNPTQVPEDAGRSPDRVFEPHRLEARRGPRR